eukprot:scaffold317_cov260-Pinguiococcus_pyrenoidosus.AAC.52
MRTSIRPFPRRPRSFASSARRRGRPCRTVDGMCQGRSAANRNRAALLARLSPYLLRQGVIDELHSDFLRFVDEGPLVHGGHAPETSASVCARYVASILGRFCVSKAASSFSAVSSYEGEDPRRTALASPRSTPESPQLESALSRQIDVRLRLVAARAEQDALALQWRSSSRHARHLALRGAARRAAKAPLAAYLSARPMVRVSGGQRRRASELERRGCLFTPGWEVRGPEKPANTSARARSLGRRGARFDAGKDMGKKRLLRAARRRFVASWDFVWP